MSEHHHHSRHRLACDAVEKAAEAARPICAPDADPAIIIGLALSHVRQGGQGNRSIPAPVMAYLDMLADRGDPTCRMVRHWISRRRATSSSHASKPPQRRCSDHRLSAEIIAATSLHEVL
ncbi:hypothetical protein [Pseudorhizobium flavum]|uniref:hypothetical protein n=1 Tax=Pseudorhizobium flavum TaxID=1335061 RepID=UPI00377048BD